VILPDNNFIAAHQVVWETVQTDYPAASVAQFHRWTTRIWVEWLRAREKVVKKTKKRRNSRAAEQLSTNSSKFASTSNYITDSDEDTSDDESDDDSSDQYVPRISERRSRLRLRDSTRTDSPKTFNSKSHIHTSPQAREQHDPPIENSRSPNAAQPEHLDGSVPPGTAVIPNVSLKRKSEGDTSQAEKKRAMGKGFLEYLKVQLDCGTVTHKEVMDQILDHLQGGLN